MRHTTPLVQRRIEAAGAHAGKRIGAAPGLPLGASAHGAGVQGFDSLMPYRIREVLLVSSLYDAFILQEDGQVAELFLEEGGDLSGPRMTRVSNGVEAMDLLEKSARFDLIIVTPQIGSPGPLAFAEEVKAEHGGIPVVLLGYDEPGVAAILDAQERKVFDEAFLWGGDALILRGIIALIEDRANCLHDSEKVGVQAVLLVEDSLSFLSSYLPLLYSEIIGQVRQVISDGLNLSHKLLRMRARPKILLARDLRTAQWLYQEHKRHLLGVITDVGFPAARGAKKEPRAGFQLVEAIRAEDENLPILMQSSEHCNEAPAQELGAGFVGKDSPYLHLRIREFMLKNFGFGPFLFYSPEGFLEAKARSIRELRDVAGRVTLECLMHHAAANDFSTWLRARTEFELAERLSTKTIADFADGEELRRHLLTELDRSRRESQRGAIADFDRRTFDDTIHFSRIGSGSLGGKARGLAFVNHLLRHHWVQDGASDVDVVVPRAVVISTEFFDRFMADNELYDAALGAGYGDRQRRQLFLRARLPGELVSDLRAILTVFRRPLAVRSSSLLEDAHFQPFAGIYETLMVPNCATDEERLIELCRTIKLVYASAYTSRARAYLRSTSYQHEEEKMAVVIQEVVGRDHEGRYYPSFAGVARSHNYYPHGQVRPEDGVVSVGLGLGRLVVAGEGGLRFCPRYPQSLPDFSSVDDVLKNAQRHFYALNLACGLRDPDEAGVYQPERYEVSVAAADGTLGPIGSIYSHENQTVYDGVSRPGTPLVTFAGVLKHELFPLAHLTERLLELGAWGMGCPVELEFAVDLERDETGRRQLALLQMRPMVVSHEDVGFDVDDYASEDLVCRSDRVFGNGRIEGLFDVLFVDPGEFERSKSVETAGEIAELNARLMKEKRPFLLIGPGRWGSSDPWLGIPVEWGQIAGAKVVVETGFEGFRVQPSEGSHFFHNMTSFRVGYFTLNPQDGEGELNLDWLRAQEPVERRDNGLVHLRLDEPVTAVLDGREARGAVVIRTDRPAATEGA